MQINISGKQIQITPAIEEYIKRKVDRLTKHYDRIQAVSVICEKEPVGYHVEVRTDVERHDDFIANAKHEDLYACVDLVIDRALRQVSDHKDRIRDHKH